MARKVTAMNFSNAFKSIACGFLFTLFVGACTAAKQQNDLVRMRLATDPPTIDWALAVDATSLEIITPVQEGLLSQDTQSKVEPALADKWTIDASGKVYEFHIRDNAKWSDGQPVLAQHFVDAWERLLNPSTASEYAYFLFDVQGAEAYQSGKSKDFSTVGVKAIGEKQLQVTLKNAVSYWINIPTFWVTYPIRKDLIAKYGEKWTAPGNLVSTGPYVLKEWQRESRVLLEKNPNFYDAEVLAKSPNKIEFRTVKEGSTAITLFKANQLDIVRDLPPVQIPTLTKMAEYHSVPQVRGYYVGFNTLDPKVKDVNVRKAIALAINEKELGKVLNDTIRPSKSWIPEGILGFDDSLGLQYDPKKAVETWNLVKNKPESIEIWFNSGEQNKVIAENLQSQVKKVLGLELVIQLQEWKTYLKTLSTATPTFWRLGWTADYPDPNTFMDLFTCKSGNNFTKFCNASYDTAVYEAAKLTDNNKRVEIYTRLQKQLLEQEVLFIPLFNEKVPYLVSQRVKGLVMNPMGMFSFKRIRL